MALFKKKKTVVEELTSEKLIMEQLVNDDDAFITDLARKMMAGSPLILNFENLHIDRANKVIAFMSGVVYAINGHIVEINEATYLFGNQDLYQDGSIETWLRTNLN